MASTASTLTLPSGRTLCYQEIHTPSPSPTHSPPIFYFHGFPGSRLEAACFLPGALTHNARLIGIDRPGMGLSSPQPARTFLSWPADVLALADHLQIARFAVLGTSGGSPYVLACVREIPRERLVRAVVVSGVYPLSCGTEGMLWRLWAMMWVAGSWVGKWVLPGLLEWRYGRVARDYERPERLVEVFMREMTGPGRPEGDIRVLDDLGQRRAIVEAMREAFRQGSVEVAYEFGMFGGEWGFVLEELDGRRVKVWHGTDDVNTPRGMAEKAAEKLRGVELRMFEGETHMSVPANHFDEIFGDLLKVD